MIKKSLLTFIISLTGFLSVGGLATINLVDTFVLSHTEGGGDDIVSNDDITFTDDGEEETITNSQIIYETADYQCASSTKLVSYHLIKVVLGSNAYLHRSIDTNSKGKFGANIKETVSQQVEEVEAAGHTVLAAINGDNCFYSLSNLGYVISDGAYYPRTDKTLRSGNYQDFAIFANGTCLSYSEQDYSLDTIAKMNGGCWQNFCFGPSLIQDSALCVNENSEIDGKSMHADQRSAIGFAGDKTFYLLTTDVNGKRNSDNSIGFRLYDLARLLQEKGCTQAYNLDGGGSATMYVKDKGVVNDNANNERALTDMIYISDYVA